MTRAIFWKEWREQRATIAVLTTAGCALILGGAGLFGLTPSTEIASLMPAGHALLMLLVVVANLACGAALFAGEREGRTQGLLDQLPVSRGRLWLAKSAFGLIVCVGQTTSFVAAAWWAGFFLWDTGSWLLFYSALGFASYCWGLFGSAIAGSALSAVGVAVLAATVGWVPSVLVGNPIALTISALIAVCLSALIYTRGFGRWPSSTLRRFRFRFIIPSSIRQAFWQSRRLALWLAVIGLLGGSAFFIPGYRAIVTYPILSLIIGWLCGIAVFHDITKNGEQRMPPGHPRLSKVLVCLLIAVTASLLLLAPGLLAILLSGESIIDDPYATEDYLSFLMSSNLPSLYPGMWAELLFLWVGYGFVAGHTAGLLSRKPLVAGPVALAVGAGMALLWWPSVITGGLHLWQVWTPPLIVVVGMALLSRHGRVPRVVTVAACLVLALGTQALGIAYRVWEIPDAPDRLEGSGFAESLSVRDEDEARRLFLDVARALDEAVDPDDRRLLLWVDELWNASADDRIVAGAEVHPERLDELFAHTWDERLSALPGLPLGVIERPDGSDTAGHARDFDRINAALMMRGIQQQHKGRPEVFLDHLGTGLALVRNYRNKTWPEPALLALAREKDWHVAHDFWLARLGDRPELLRRSLEIWKRHLAEMPTSVEEVGLAGRMVMRGSILDPKQWLSDMAGRYPPEDPEFRRNQLNSDLQLVLTAIQIPWEQERLRRIYRLGWVDPRAVDSNRTWNWPFVMAFRFDWLYPHLAKRAELFTQATRRATVLALALQLYRIDSGRPAERLEQLVPGYLDAVPTDPFDGKPFRYRVSTGEQINMEKDTPLELSPGDGVLWSVGRDRTDGGGVIDWRAAPYGEPADQIYLVPRHPE